ncbi:MAG: 30S ribosomal protein S12 methylthiotransferase RimO [Clostridia bacterium]|nr:30S ribosomal protein S12 methylthiotransferase RimO [Clostridia bacterium]
MTTKIGFVSLGCSKNLVDTEMIIGYYKNKGYEIVADVNEAEIIVINTCGFIEAAKQEAIDTILEMADYKVEGNCQKLVVTGCLVERYEEELKKELPEVDLFVPIRDYDKIFEKLEYNKREISTGNNYAYLKIAEGCSNNCTYCAIPLIRGPYISRKYEDILEEAKQLEKKGIKELIVIAQDTTKYGIDLYGKSRLPELLQDLCKLDFKWIRFLYSYPESITDELIEVVKNNPKICNYFDIPIQHISDSVLKRMGRRTTGNNIRNIIKKIKQEIPDVILRTSLIVGFPGETEENFKELKEFVKEAKFNRLGVFKYSKEDGTPAVKLRPHLDAKTKEKRYKEIMKEQQKVSKENNNELIGKEIECMIEGITDDGEYYISRSYMDVPNEDGLVFIENLKVYQSGDFTKVDIIEALDYDLIAREK